MAWSDDYSWNVFPSAKSIQGREHYHHGGVANFSRSDWRFVCSWCHSFWPHIRQGRPDEDNGARGYWRVWLSSPIRFVLPLFSNTQLCDIRFSSCPPYFSWLPQSLPRFSATSVIFPAK